MHGEFYKHNVGRDLSDTKFNQSVLQMKKKAAATFLQVTQPVPELVFRPTIPDPSVFLFLHYDDFTNAWKKRSPLLLLTCLAILGEFLPISGEGSGQFPHLCTRVLEEGDVFLAGTEIEIPMMNNTKQGCNSVTQVNSIWGYVWQPSSM